MLYKKRNYTVMTSEQCEFLCLNKKYFKKIFFKECKKVGLEMAKQSISRIKKHKLDYRKALEHLIKKDQIKQEGRGF